MPLTSAHINPLIVWAADVTVDFSVCSQLGTAYVSATTGAVATALGLNALTKVSVHLTPFFHLIDAVTSAAWVC